MSEHLTRPLNDEQIEWLVERFAAAKRRIEAVWGPKTKPWKRDDDE